MARCIFKRSSLTLFFLLSTAWLHGIVNMTIVESGGDVILSGSGTLDISSLTQGDFNGDISYIKPNTGEFLVGTGNSTFEYSIPVGGPTSFGSGIIVPVPSSSSGDNFGILGTQNQLLVFDGYSNNALISGSATWDSNTLSGLGLSPGVYTWNWGSGDSADSMNLTIVPESKHWALLTGGAISLALATSRRLRKRAR